METPKTLTRDQCLFMADLANQAKRYKDTMKYMNDLIVFAVSPTSELTPNEAKKLVMAYNNAIGPLRASWRTVTSIVKRNEARNNGGMARLSGKYRERIELEISEICEGSLKLLREVLIPSASSTELKVFFQLMKGDLERYLAEMKVGSERREVAEKAMHSYETAQKLAVADLGARHPLRLGVALNFSVFHYTILSESEKACEMAEKAISEANVDLMMLHQYSYKESLPILLRLKENMVSWQSIA